LRSGNLLAEDAGVRVESNRFRRGVTFVPGRETGKCGIPRGQKTYTARCKSGKKNGSVWKKCKRSDLSSHQQARKFGGGISRQTSSKPYWRLEKHEKRVKSKQEI